jgi:two-component system, NarL family, response regulator DesR
MTVLIADDSRLMRDRIRETISIFSEVEIVSETDTGNKTLSELNKHHPDLAIIDIRMPEGNGIEILKKYRETNKSTKILILTNYAYDQYKNRALEAGADFFHSKSEDFEKIASVIALMLRRQI